MKNDLTIALDARTVYSESRRGTGKNLIDLYTLAARKRPNWRFVMLHRGQCEGDPFAGLDNVENICGEMPGDRYNAWLNLKLPLMARAAGADLLHCPANVAPKFKLLPYIMTLHDLIPLTGKDEKYVAWWRKNVAAGLAKARGVITPSEFSKQQIVSEFGGYSDKILVNHWAADSDIKCVTDEAQLAKIREKYGIDPARRYVFGYGADDVRKNTQRLLEVWSLLDEGLKKEYQLVLVGLNDRALKRFAGHLECYKCGDSVKLCGFADESDMAGLMSGATLLCYPSLSEGFGLPVLDAFACRTAVLTSDMTSLPEVGGDAAVYVAPKDVSSMVDGLSRLMMEEDLREELVDKGWHRLNKFTWDACVDRFVDFIERIF